MEWIILEFWGTEAQSGQSASCLQPSVDSQSYEIDAPPGRRYI
ncbi:MAG: hypothetical protein P8074_25440 [Anaerolineales bacterium]